MTNEIKEILYLFEKYHFEDTMIDSKECKLLYDYITNLQEENEKLKKAVKENVIATCNTCEWFGVCPHSYREYDYKTQIDKAIKYIENKTCELDICFGSEDWHLTTVKKLLEILRGEK